MHLQTNFSRSNLNSNDLTAKISKTMSYEAVLKRIQLMVGSAMWSQLHVLRSMCAERGKLTANWRKKK
jgi:predicted secreted protein